MANTDLNLLVIFDTIMQEQSITLAAERMSMTQPSVSNAVSRMRHVWGDPLFVKQGRGIRPTPFAENLWLEINEPLQRIRAANTPTKFDPSRLKTSFRIALTDWMVDLFWLPLRRIIEAQAPGVNLHAVPYTVNGEALLRSANVDLVLDYYEGSDNKIESQHLFDNHFVCAMRYNHPLANKTLSLKDFARAEHLLFSLSGEAAASVDSVLQQQNMHRRIAMTVNHSYHIPKLLAHTDMITTVPFPLILDSVERGSLIIKKLPFHLCPAPISMTWHHRQQHSAQSLWLRSSILKVLQNDLSQRLLSPPF
ncbi:MAG: LysR family transcriptional regulator [Pseudomonadales bacterium]